MVLPTSTMQVVDIHTDAPPYHCPRHHHDDHHDNHHNDHCHPDNHHDEDNPCGYYCLLCSDSPALSRALTIPSSLRIIIIMVVIIVIDIISIVVIIAGI